MEKLNTKKIIIIVIIALVVVSAIILGIIFLGKNNVEEGKGGETGTISLTESEFEPLKVKDIEVTYKEDGSETVIDFGIENTTDEKVEKQTINIQLLDKDNGLIAGVETYVETIDAKSTHKVNMMLAGNIQGIEKIKLVKPAKQEETPAEEEQQAPAE